VPGLVPTTHLYEEPCIRCLWIMVFGVPVLSHKPVCGLRDGALKGADKKHNPAREIVKVVKVASELSVIRSQVRILSSTKSRERLNPCGDETQDQTMASMSCRHRWK
jgi:hypothetical protein